jgi:hypothetical protein
MTMQASSTSFKPVTDRSWCQSIICSWSQKAILYTQDRSAIRCKRWLRQFA